MSTVNKLAKVFVSNLTYTAKWQAVKSHFSQSGNVMFVKLINDQATQKPKGMGVVTFEKEEEAQHAIQNLNGSDFEGRQIKVREYQERQPRTFSEEQN